VTITCAGQFFAKFESASLKDKKGQIRFARLLAYLPDEDGLTDDKPPMIQRCGSCAIGFLNGESQPTLAETRNKLAHGYPFEVDSPPEVRGLLVVDAPQPMNFFAIGQLEDTESAFLDAIENFDF
jgi:hypothetical protein